MCTQLALILAGVSGCLCLAEYQLFPGFNDDDSATLSTAAATTTMAATTAVFATNTTVSTTTSAATAAHAKGTTTTVKPKLVTYHCPKEEKPANIGPYEVPTQRDLALLAKKTLRKMFASYHQKAIYFLDDIGKATRATEQVANKCVGNKDTYKRCVRHVSTQCQTITKSYADSIEKMSSDVNAFSQNSICSITEMKADPVNLIKTLAMEEVALKFALPGFLRLLNACSRYCYNSTSNTSKILRHQVFQDPIIKKFLTRKRYNQVFMNRKYRRYDLTKNVGKIIERIRRTERIDNNR